MAKQRLQIKVPIDIFDSNWAYRTVTQMCENLKTVIKNESKKLRKEVVEHARNVYDQIIKEYYSTYDPAEYSRHGLRTGFNLYYANNAEFKGDIFEIKPKPDNLLNYYTMAEMRRIYSGKEDVVESTVDNDFILYDRVLAGKRPMLYWTDGRFTSSYISFRPQDISIPNVLQLSGDKPINMLDKAEEQLVEYYDTQLAERSMKSYKEIERIWVR